MNEFPVLQTERLVLREFKEADIPAVYAIFSKDAVTEHYNFETMCTIGQAQRLVKARRQAFYKEAGVRWAITRRGQSNGVIGSCGCYNLHKTFCSMEIGYDLHPDFWRQGIMSEALEAMLTFCFGKRFLIPLNRVVALTELENLASIGLLLKLGFQPEGIHREYGFWKGTFRDVRSFSLLRRDWEQ
ncbi:MAG: GNAT family protein [Anaerolineae bacterium]